MGDLQLDEEEYITIRFRKGIVANSDLKQTNPKLLSSFHGRRRIPPHSSSSHALVSSPATPVKFKPKFLHFHGIQHSSCKPLLASPATMEFNPKFLHFLPCHGFSHSSCCNPFLGSPATTKLSPVLFALPRDNEEFSSDNEKEPIVQEDHTSISPDDVHKEQSKKVSGGEVKEGEFVVREATVTVEFMASAMLRAKGLYQYDPNDRDVGSSVVKHAVKECDEIVTQFKERNIRPFMCIIAVRKEGENNRTGLLKFVMGTLDFSVQDPLREKTYPEEVVTASKIITSKFKQRKSQKYGIISKMTVTKTALQQDVDVGSSMLKFAIESAKDKGIKQVFLLVSGDNKPALALYEKMGLTILELPRDNEESSSDNKEEPIIPEHEELRTLISSDNVHEEQLKKLGGGEVNKLEFVVREATYDKEFWSSAYLKAAGLDEGPSGDRIIFEFNEIKWRRIMRPILPFTCIIAVRKEGENVLTGMPKNGIGTLDFRVKYLSPGEALKEIVMAKMIKTFKQSKSLTYGIISNVAVDKSARQQSVGSSMLKFVIEFAKENGIPKIFLQVRRDNKPALALFGKMGFTISAKAMPLQEEPNMYTCSLDL